MVVLRTIENLRERPVHERRAVAFGIAIAAMMILFLGWIVFFFRGVQVSGDLGDVNAAYSAAVQQAQQSYESTQNTQAVQNPETPGEVQLIDETSGESAFVVE